MDEHSGLNRANVIGHIKTFNANTHLNNGPTTYPIHPQPRISYNPTFTNSNKELPNYK
jgi:hypothetical protein